MKTNCEFGDKELAALNEIISEHAKELDAMPTIENYDKWPMRQRVIFDLVTSLDNDLLRVEILDGGPDD